MVSATDFIFGTTTSIALASKLCSFIQSLNFVIASPIYAVTSRIFKLNAPKTADKILNAVLNAPPTSERIKSNTENRPLNVLFNLSAFSSESTNFFEKK